MKKLVLLNLVGILLFINSGLFAQEFNYGIGVGFDIANSRLSNKPDRDNASRFYYPMPSFNVNGYIGYKSAGFWGLSIEPGFIQKGGMYKSQEGEVGSDYRRNLNYLHAPLLVNLFLTEKFSFSIGPELEYLMNEVIKSDGVTSIFNSGNFIDKFEISGIVGLNYNLHKNFDIGLRYSHGITPTSIITWTDAQGLALSDSNEYNQYSQVFVRFKI